MNGIKVNDMVFNDGIALFEAKIKTGLYNHYNNNAMLILLQDCFMMASWQNVGVK